MTKVGPQATEWRDPLDAVVSFLLALVLDPICNEDLLAGLTLFVDSKTTK